MQPCRLTSPRHNEMMPRQTSRKPMDTPTTSNMGADIPADLAATLVSAPSYADHCIHDAYRWLRANNPLGIARPEGFDPFWVVTKHAHIQAISRQNDLFHNADRPDDSGHEGDGGADAPDHQQTESGAVAGANGCARPSEIPGADAAWFMPVNLGKFEKRVRTIASGAVERMMAHGGRCDFVADVALGYPLARHHGNSRGSGKGRAEDAQADPGAVRRAGSGHSAGEG